MNSTLTRRLLAGALIFVPYIALGEGDDKKLMPLTAVISGRLASAPTVDHDRCPDPMLPVRIEVAGSAQTTLGRAQFTQTHCEDEQHTLFGNAAISIVFDDGTKLSGTCQGQILRTPTFGLDYTLMISGQYRDTGGTGSFATAHGKGSYVGTVNVSSFAVTLAFSGTL